MDFPLALVVPESLSGAISTVRDERLTDNDSLHTDAQTHLLSLLWSASVWGRDNGTFRVRHF